jgi:hypothetical protein
MLARKPETRNPKNRNLRTRNPKPETRKTKPETLKQALEKERQGGMLAERLRLRTIQATFDPKLHTKP